MSTRSQFSSQHQEEDLKEAEFVASISDLNLDKLNKLFWFAALKRFLQFNCKLNGVDLIELPRERSLSDKTTIIARIINNWPSFLRLLFSLIALKVMIGTYRSYQFDFYRFRSIQYQRLNITNDKAVELRRKTQEAQENLIGSGILYQNLNFFSETWNIVFIGSFIMLNYGLHLAFCYFSKMHYLLGGILLDFKRQKLAYLRIVLRVARTLIISSKNYHQIRLGKGNNIQQSQLIEPNSKRHPSEHRQLIIRLRSTLLAGQFGPLSWQSEWLSLIGLLHFSLTATIWLYSIGLVLYMYVFFPMISIKGQNFNWFQVIKSADEILMSVLCLVAASFYIPLVVSSDLDHIRHIKRLIEITRACKFKNDVQFQCILRLVKSKLATKTTNEEPKRSLTTGWNIRYRGKQLNDNLLFVLVHYRVSVLLSKRMGNMSAIFLLGGVSIFFFFPVTFMLHAPYVNDDVVRLTYTMLCVGNLMVIDLICAPMCYLHSRAFDLYRAMSSLLAHSIECQQQLETLDESSVYDNHLVCLLRKELDDPERMAKQFSIVVLGTPMAYSTLLRIHFWFGLLMLIIINGITSRSSEMFGQFFADPFGLFLV